MLAAGASLTDNCLVLKGEWRFAGQQRGTNGKAPPSAASSVQYDHLFIGCRSAGKHIHAFRGVGLFPQLHQRFRADILGCSRLAAVVS